MSRAYRITVKESLSRHVQVEDGVASNLELLPILPKERTRELLAAELEKRGFTRDGATAKRTPGAGITIEVDLDSGAVSVTAEGHADLELERARTRVSEDPDRHRVREGVAKALKESLEEEAKGEEEALRRKVTAQLEETLRGLKGELDEVATRVTAEALKQKAAELGQVEEVHEDANGGLVIKVRV